VIDMNRAAICFGVLGVAIAAYAPLALYANQDEHVPEAQASADGTAASSESLTVAVRTPSAASVPQPRAAASGDAHAIPAASYTEGLPAARDGDYDVPVWAVVTRGARLHSGPDVSSSTTWFYPVGAKLHVTGYREGWYKVIDPETQRTGYIYASYYLDALSGPDVKAPLVAAKPEPKATHTATHMAMAEPTKRARPAVRYAWRTPPSLLGPAENSAPVRPARRGFFFARRDGVDGLLDRALRR
jgi:hypothetical protein